jgi:hypothetical protein
VLDEEIAQLLHIRVVKSIDHTWSPAVPGCEQNVLESRESAGALRSQFRPENYLGGEAGDQSKTRRKAERMNTIDILTRDLHPDPADVRKTRDSKEFRNELVLLGQRMRVHSTLVLLAVRRNGAGFIVTDGHGQRAAVLMADIDKCCMGIDLELALGFDYRLAASHPKAGTRLPLTEGRGKPRSAGIGQCR